MSFWLYLRLKIVTIHFWYIPSILAFLTLVLAFLEQDTISRIVASYSFQGVQILELDVLLLPHTLEDIWNDKEKLYQMGKLQGYNWQCNHGVSLWCLSICKWNVESSTSKNITKDYPCYVLMDMEGDFCLGCSFNVSLPIILCFMDRIEGSARNTQCGIKRFSQFY